MKKVFYAAVLLGLVCAGGLLIAADSTPEQSTLTKQGQEAPVFTATTLDGRKFDLKGLRGKVVLINFFATWCGPCMEEMPHLEKDVWQKYKDKNFVMISIGREHSQAELAEFLKKHSFTFALAPDPKREIYKQFATQYIPRNYVIDAEGKIAFQSMGYNADEFAKMISLIDREVAKTAKN